MLKFDRGYITKTTLSTIVDLTLNVLTQLSILSQRSFRNLTVNYRARFVYKTYWCFMRVTQFLQGSQPSTDFKLLFLLKWI